LKPGRSAFITRAALAPSLGSALAGLKRHRTDQTAYAEPAASIALHVAAMLEAGDEDERARDDGDDATTDPWAAFSLLLDNVDSIDDTVATAMSGPSRVLDAAAGRYRVFTTAYDREVAAAGLVRAEVLLEARERLDARIAEVGVNLARLARELKALLAVPVHEGWDSAQEQGLIDGRRLGQLIASPTERRLFRSPRIEALAACRVTFLIDCSGSMKEHAETVAVLVDVLVRALEMIDVASEVLGFTTGAWNGGRAQRDWRRAGRPPHPGRLNEACHIVFKAAAQRWRAARTPMAALLRGELFREGLDGEALEWALQRQHSDADADHDERRLVFVVSDGSPMDSATSLANDAHYLDQHLRDVVARHDGAGVEIYGLGVGLDLSPYYRRSQVLDLSAPLGGAVLRDVLGLLARRRGR
jgi:cobaltochelatase CobT